MVLVAEGSFSDLRQVIKDFDLRSDSTAPGRPASAHPAAGTCTFIRSSGPTVGPGRAPAAPQKKHTHTYIIAYKVKTG